MTNTRGKRKETLPVDEVMSTVDEMPDVVAPKPSIKEGLVYNCSSLNVRQAPSKEAEILNVISKDTKVKVLDDASDEWYKVRVNGVGTGFCMKEFIKVGE